MSEIFSIISGLAVGVGKSVANIFTGNVIGAVGIPNAIFILAMFAVFVLLMKKAMSTVINVLIVAAAAVSFPFIANYLGFAIPITYQTLVFFVIMGVAVYAVFMIGRFILKLLSPSKKIQQT